MIHLFERLIAKGYYNFYVHFMQRPPDQPYTAQAARMEERWPSFVWGVALIIWFVTARYLHGWWLLLTGAVYLFSWWWCHHICNYERTHPGNNPFMPWNQKLANKAFIWASRRLHAD